MNFSNSNVNNQIPIILKNIGFNLKLSGSIYLIDSINYIFSLKLLSFDNLHKDIFPYIAKKHNTSIKRVKWAIERCIKYLYKTNKTQAYNSIYNYFGIEYPNKVSTKVLINLITNYIQNHYNDI